MLKAQEVSKLKDKIREGKERYSTLWRMNCSQLIEYDEAMANKEEELRALKERVAMLESAHHIIPSATVPWRDSIARLKL